MKRLAKKIIPKRIRNLRHLFYAWLGARKHRHPSEKLFVIGVTGTSGKSSTVHFLRQIFEHVGYTVGSLSTVDFYIAGEKKLNDQKMTMLGLSQIQAFLAQMVEKKCDIAIIETTSEGAVQHRHRFINYDMIVLTNLYPEHIESHGSFEKYKQVKLDIFGYVSQQKRKKKENLPIKKLPNFASGIIDKISVINANSKWADDFLVYPFDKKYLFSRNDSVLHVEKDKLDHDATLILGKEVLIDGEGIHFVVDEYTMHAKLYGEYNVSNLLSAIAVARALDIDLKAIQEALKKIAGTEGRIEFIQEAKDHGFDVIVDYAFEPVAIEELYKVVKRLHPKRIIHVFGSTGGGRDIARRYTVGKYVGEHADICIVTDEDPYDDDPMEIINQVAYAVEETGKHDGVDLFKILDRKEAIQKAIKLAQPDDVVLVTGKGSEQGMIKRGEMISWDDREIVREMIEMKAISTLHSE